MACEASDCFTVNDHKYTTERVCVCVRVCVSVCLSVCVCVCVCVYLFVLR